MTWLPIEYQRKHRIVRAVQLVRGRPLPNSAGIDLTGHPSVRISDYSHDSDVRWGDYVVWDEATKKDGESWYPTVWWKNDFERVFELAKSTDDQILNTVAKLKAELKAERAKWRKLRAFIVAREREHTRAGHGNTERFYCYHAVFERMSSLSRQRPNGRPDEAD